ncbi:MAG TPA: hypothetical protein PL110_08740 [Candidatus Eremiobacteraeota bacterium]|nr:MAG: hypothetical protein BWY64_00340 [bacterium ADurb.Bin363]HPZ08187.1 hypothetical protein [Candidatus Eremiobacteraeota bacterium]
METSVRNFYFVEDAPDKKKATVEFFDEVVSEGLVNIFISASVIKEVNNAPPEKRKRILSLIGRCNVEILEIKKEKITWKIISKEK